jgi:hypothetical protein
MGIMAIDIEGTDYLMVQTVNTMVNTSYFRSAKRKAKTLFLFIMLTTSFENN